MVSTSASGSRFAEPELIEQAVGDLVELLGPGWDVRQQTPPDRRMDAVWTVIGPDGHRATLLVEVQKSVAPAAVERILAPQLERNLRALPGGATALVVAPWLSPRTRQVLDDEGIGYLDVTGNVSLRVTDPAIVIRIGGDQRDPDPKPEIRRGIAGPRAGRIVRQLVDFEPPRRVRELAVAAGISESYTSRLLDTMVREALIRREGRVVSAVDWPNVLRVRGQAYELMRVNHVVGAVARRGVEWTLEAIRAGNSPHQVLMTGTMAANHYSPLVVGGTLMFYVPPGPHAIDEVLRELGLLRATSGAAPTVQLLQPLSDGAFDRPGPTADGIPMVGLSQLVLDCLSGPGRLPAAGQALIEWMETHPWREPSPIAGQDSNPLA